jgi:chromatin segregation and condensation protein Rec8/ScpA/Scc1 (kleisin family)
MMEYKPKPKRRTIRASQLLKAKIGSGEIDPRRIARAQSVIDHNDVDYSSYAIDFFNRLQDAIQHYQKSNDTEKKSTAVTVRAELAQLVMVIKASAGMFGYPLLTTLSDRLLSFLESLEAIDDDAVEIVVACHKTFTLIVVNRLKGDGGPYGHDLNSELREAILRYFTKRGETTLGNDRDVYAIDP